MSFQRNTQKRSLAGDVAPNMIPENHLRGNTTVATDLLSVKEEIAKSIYSFLAYPLFFWVYFTAATTHTTQDSLPDFYSTQSSQNELAEKETRELIDKLLRQVGWEADTKALRYSNGIRPAKGRNIAIAEWPVDSDVVDGGAADYALFIGEKLVCFIEAKKWGKDVASEIDFQGKEYARSVHLCDYSLCIGEWGEYHVPFIFTTNVICFVILFLLADV